MPFTEMDSIKVNVEKPKISFKQKLRNYFTEFSSNTGIHGIKYIGEQKRSVFELLFWTVALTISLFFCVKLILKTYQKWENSPVIVSFATKETPNWQIPFPALTICPDSKSVPERFNYAKYLYYKIENRKLNSDEEKKFSYVSLLCQPRLGLTFNTSELADEDVFDVLEKVSPRFMEDISDCKLMGKLTNCSTFFTPIITDEGLCYSFNILNREDILADKVIHYKNYHKTPRVNTEWSLEYGYLKNASEDAYPRRALYAGAIFAVEVKLQMAIKDVDLACSDSVKGFKIQLHHPSMMPRVKQQHFPIPFDQEVIAAVMPSMIVTSEEVKSYKPQRRMCYVASERNLKYFKVYTQLNCQIECKTNYTLQQCGCVNFYMPREKGTKICGAPRMDCMRRAEDYMLTSGIRNQLNEKNEGQRKLKNASVKCDCLPDCTSISFVLETYQSPWNWVRKFQKDERTSTPNRSTHHMSHLKVYFKGNQFITSERNELYGPTDFLANFGGLLGLFTGFSLLSLIEIIYFLSLRLICNVKLYGIENWNGNNEK